MDCRVFIFGSSCVDDNIYDLGVKCKFIMFFFKSVHELAHYYSFAYI